MTVIDTPGFGDYVNNRDSWMPIVEFIDDQHESYMLQEQQPRRTDKIDLRVHACLYFIRPTGHTLKPLDIEVMKRLSTRVNLIPVVAKADTLSPKDLAIFKQRIRAVIDAQGIKIYQPPVEEDDEAAAQHARSLMVRYTGISRRSFTDDYRPLCLLVLLVLRRTSRLLMDVL